MKYMAAIAILGCSLLIVATGFCDNHTYGASSEKKYATFEEAAVASASTKPTQKMIKDKIEEACTMLKSVGVTAGFEKLKDPNGGYAFAGTYIWVHDWKNIMRMHPIKTHLDGQNLMSFKDVAGKRFFITMSITAVQKGSGWVGYMWPKPGEKKSSQKVSFVKQCVVNGDRLVLGSGVYDIDMSNLDLE